MNGQGGSYIRQPDGSLKLTSRTETAKPETKTPAPRKPAGKKDTDNG